MKKDTCIKTNNQYPKCHASSICELPNGNLLACCFAGTEEGASDQVIIGTSYNKARKSWEHWKVWVDVPHRASGNPRVFQGPAGNNEIWLIAPVTYGVWCSGSTRLFMKRSYDEGKSWKDLELLIDDKGILGKNKPFIEGDLVILPVEREDYWNVKFLRSEDRGESWELVGDLGRESGIRVIQPTIVRLKNGDLMAYMRSQENYIYKSYSTDNGKHWSEPIPSSLPNNNSGIDMVRLHSGRLLLAYNPTKLTSTKETLEPGLPVEIMAGFDTWGPRTPLILSLSYDDGKHWRNHFTIEDGPGSYSYPAVIQADDGMIHVTYTNNRESITHVQLTEEEILKGL